MVRQVADVVAMLEGHAEGRRVVRLALRAPSNQRAAYVVVAIVADF